MPILTSRELQYLPLTTDKAHWMLEIRNRYKDFLLKMGGEEVWLFKRKWVGTRCPSWDTIRNQHRQVSKCATCYGTGFVGGYYEPIKIVASLIFAAREKVVQFEYGLRREFELRSWTLWIPRLRNKDFIRRANNQCHWIQNVTPTRWRNIYLRQNFDLAEVEPSNVLYNVPVE